MGAMNISLLPLPPTLVPSPPTHPAVAQVMRTLGEEGGGLEGGEGGEGGGGLEGGGWGGLEGRLRMRLLRACHVQYLQRTGPSSKCRQSPGSVP